jgi:predicted phosphodiesterase
MRIAVASDVHLEFGPLLLKNEQNADVLVLSGDILTAKQLDFAASTYGDMYHSNKAMRFIDFIKMCTFQFPHVVYVLGNHEHYNYDFKYSAKHIKEQLQQFKNLYVLDDECVKIDDVTFIGGTMWTNMNKEDPLTLFHVKSMMNDFRIIKNSHREVFRTVPIYEYNEDGSLKKDEKGYNIPVGHKKKAEPAYFSPEDSVEAHKKFIGYLELMTEGKDEKFVVCTHHSPSFQSVAPWYANDQLMNGAYHSSLEELIERRPCIKLWTHGHTHEPFDYMVHDTRVVCNPRGYVGHEQRAKDFELKYVEI